MIRERVWMRHVDMRAALSGRVSTATFNQTKFNQIFTLRVWRFAEKWSMHVCANKHAQPTTASIDPSCGEIHDIFG